MNDRWERLIDLYHAAVSLPADERTTLLDEECGADSALRGDVERMIVAHHRVHRPTGAAAAVVPMDALAVASPASMPDPAPPAATAVAVVPTPRPAGEGDHVPTGIATAPLEGEPVDAYADTRNLSIAERLQLFVQVCGSVTSARRRGVTYGELTPAAILISPSGVPKLPDVGLGDGEPTPAGDVYSLGVILDGLLAGGEPGARRAMRRELEAIVVRGLRREGQRYESVEALADDVRSYLDAPSAPRHREPRRARPGTSSRRRGGALVAWGLAAAAVSALGVKVMELMEHRVERVAAAPPVEVSAGPTRLLVADLADRARDPLLAAALSDALRAGLTESPSVRVTASQGRGADAEVTGSIEATTGGAFTFAVRLVNRHHADAPASLQETASDSTDVVRALSRLAVRLRQQLGESPTSIAVTPRLEDVTTASLPALRAFAGGSSAISAGQRAAGIRLLRSAVALDTGFAAAHQLLSRAYRDAADGTRASEAFGHAIANQARLPFYERNQMVASHAMKSSGGHGAAIDAYNRILARDARDVRVLASLGAVHAARGEYAAQESLLVRAIAVDPNAASLRTGLAVARLHQGRYDDARRVLAATEQKFPGLRSTQLVRIALAASQQDWDAAEREARELVGRASGDSADALDGVATLGAILMTQGRLGEAAQQLRRAVTLGARYGAVRQSYAAALSLAYLELRYRQSPGAAIATVNAVLVRSPLARLEPDARPYEELARFFANAGSPKRAADLMAQAARAAQLTDRGGSDATHRWTVGAIAMAERRAWEGEIEIRGAAETHPCPICALPDLARAYEVAGKPDSAIATYERYLRTPWQRRFETDAVDLGFAMKRLGELYQQQNDRGKAAAQYTALLKLWRDADAELAPQVADVRRRLEESSR